MNDNSCSAPRNASARVIEPDLFDSSAREFARNTDVAIANGRYVRGRVFLAAMGGALRPPARILDYGCGPGRLAFLFWQRGYEVVGVDQSSGMLAEAKKVGGGHHGLAFMSVSEFSWPGEAFDGVICSSVIEYVVDAEALLRRFWTALRPGGYLAISFANRRSLWRLWARLKARGQAPHMLIQHNRWLPREAERILAATGFTIAGPASYFESPADTRWPRLGSSSWIGTLGLILGQKKA